jgi:ribulose-phosphate 3-epimerase
MSGKSIRIAPSLLSADFARLGEEIAAVERAGADLLHLDVMDGHFVPNITIGPPVLASLRKVTRLPFDVHLMIEKPERYIAAFAEAGADYLSVQVETCPHLHRVLTQIREAGCLAGAALNPGTPVAALENVLPQLDFVLVMSVNPGFGGQKFIPGALPKIAAVAELLRRAPRPVEIEVDGGIGPDNIAEVVAAGAGMLVAGSAVFGHPPYEKAIARMKEAGAAARR